jgi:hypothetical protein
VRGVRIRRLGPAYTSKELQDKNITVVMLNQALLGAIGNNFRQVAIRFGDADLLVRFVLEHENDVDRQEIADVMAQFEAYLYDVYERFGDLGSEILVSGEPLDILDMPWRVIFRRRDKPAVL